MSKRHRREQTSDEEADRWLIENMLKSGHTVREAARLGGFEVTDVLKYAGKDCELPPMTADEQAEHDRECREITETMEEYLEILNKTEKSWQTMSKGEALMCYSILESFVLSASYELMERAKDLEISAPCFRGIKGHVRRAERVMKAMEEAL